MASPQLITFDFYTALVDYEGSLVPVVRKICADVANPESLVRQWRAKQLEGALISNSLNRGRISFRELTRRALLYTFERAGKPLSEQQRDELLAAWDHLEPWPEAESTLVELKTRGYKLAVLSNGDEAMLRAALRRFDLTFDHVLASDQAGVYKPHADLYALPMRKLGLTRGQVLHVAGSANDVTGAKWAGLACAWSNRNGEPMMDPTVTPDYRMSNLAELLEFL